MFWAGVISAIKKIPWQAWLLSGVIALFAMSNWWSFQRGQASTQAKWDQAVRRGKVLVKQLQSKQQDVTERIEYVYLDRWHTIEKEGKTIYEQVPVFVKSDECSLSGGFRLLHDGAVTGAAPDPTQIPDAKPVPPQDLARTVGENYTECRKAISDLEGLRLWATELERLYLELCKQPGVRCSKDN